MTSAQQREAAKGEEQEAQFEFLPLFTYLTSTFLKSAPDLERYAVRVNGLDALALTKLDVLDGLDELQICTAYTCKGQRVTEVPSDVAQLAACEPVYESFPGWTGTTKGAQRYDDLPTGAQQYLARLEELTGCPAAIISTGSERDETIIRRDTAIGRTLGL